MPLVVQDNDNNRVFLMSVREMNNFTEVCKLSHFPVSTNRLHQVNMRTHLPHTRGLQIVSVSFVGKPLAPSEHENTLASHHFAHLIYRPHIKLQLS
jgi:hypothetical protein